MKTKVTVKLKPSVLDPQGQAVLHAAHALGFENVKDIRVGKSFEVELEAKDFESAQQTLAQLSEKLLANTVIEEFEVEVQ